MTRVYIGNPDYLTTEGETTGLFEERLWSDKEDKRKEVVGWVKGDLYETKNYKMFGSHNVFVLFRVNRCRVRFVTERELWFQRKHRRYSLTVDFKDSRRVYRFGSVYTAWDIDVSTQIQKTNKTWRYPLECR